MVKKTIWPYKKDAMIDPKWIKDRDKVIGEGGNGWWRLKGAPLKNHLKQAKEQLNEKKNLRKK